MTLTTRLSMFFLATLALVLGGFSAGIYMLAREYLQQQSEERLQAALNTLVAAAEIGPAGLEWEPAERRLSLGPAALANEIVWLVTDEQGQTVDQAQQPGTENFLAEAAQASRSAEPLHGRMDWQGQRWLCSQQLLQSSTSAPTKVEASQPPQKDEGRKYQALSITVGVALQPVQSALRRLAGITVGLSLGIWCLALFLSRFVCRRALLPVTRMAVAAREMNVADLGSRLPAPASRDELEDLSRAFNHLLDRLQESFQRQQRFTGDASHQLRTPLAAMIGQVEVALRRERPAAEYQRVLTTVHQQAEHLRRIVEALLFLARADWEAKLPNLECLDLNDWLPAHLQTWSGHERGRDIHVQCNAAGPTYIQAHPALLGELLNLLVDNACKFSPSGTPITVGLFQEKNVACIEVKDQGCGISEADLPQISTPFFRSAASRQRGIEGVGLGLSVARRLAEAFGGALTVTSQIGVGSCFTLRLPAAETPLGEPEEPSHLCEQS